MISGKCDRCEKKTNMFRMSFFNLDMICESCIVKEKAHKDYKKAVSTEIEEVRKGNYNFKGIGLPKDLKKI